MVNESQDIQGLKIASKYLLCDFAQSESEFTVFLDEINSLYGLEWICVQQLATNKIFQSSNVPQDISFNRNYDVINFDLSSLVRVYIKPKDNKLSIDLDNFKTILKVIFFSYEEKDKNHMLLEITSQMRKTLKLSLALEKLKDGLEKYLNISSMLFFGSDEITGKYKTEFLFNSISDDELGLHLEDILSEDEILELPSKFNTNAKLFESRIRNDKWGYLIIEKLTPWEKDELNMLELFAEQIALVLTQHKLNSEMLSIVQREFFLNQVTARVRESLNIDELLNTATLEIAQIMGADSCAIYLLDDTRISKHKKIAFWSTDIKINPTMKAIVKSSIGSLFSNNSFGDTLLWRYNRKSISENPLLYSFHRDYNLYTFLAAAIHSGVSTEPIGYIVLAGIGHDPKWDANELQLLESIAGQLDIALMQASLYQYAEKTKKQMELLHTLSSKIRDSLDLDIVLSTTAEGLAKVLDLSRCFVRIFSDDHKILKTNQEFTQKDISPCSDIIFGFEKRWINNLFSQTVDASFSHFLHISDLKKHLSESLDHTLVQITEALSIKSYLSIPLISQSKLLGSITIHQCDQKRKFSEDEINFISQVASEAAVAIQNAELFSTIDTMSKTDQDTGLLNKKYFNSVAKKIIEDTIIAGKEISMMMIDLDHLKIINDTMGHEAGDEAIHTIASVLSNTLRQTKPSDIQKRVADVIARYGGDEFIVLLPDTNIDEALLAAERVSENLVKTKLNLWHKPLTCSIGIAGTPFDSPDFAKLKVRADQALYISKNKGRDSISSSYEL